jgi:amino acid transporter
VAVYAVILGFSASNCIIFGEYVLFALGKDPTPLTQKSLAVGLLTVITIIHGCFLTAGIRIQNFLGWVKVGLIVFMIFTSVAVLIFRRGNHGISISSDSVNTSKFPSLWEGSVWNLEVIATSLFKVFYSYAGLENINNVLNEVKDPVRTLKSVAPTALLTSCILYLMINVAYLLIIPLEEIKESRELIAALFFRRTFGEHLGEQILPLAVALSAAGNVMVVTFSLVSQTSQTYSNDDSLENRHDSTRKLQDKDFYLFQNSYLLQNHLERQWEALLFTTSLLCW